MKKIAEQLKAIISGYSEKLSVLSEDDFSRKSQPEKWSRKEELGHLIDSAHNNLRRFMVAQYEENPKIVYNQNFWVEASNYQHQPSKNMIMLWTYLNYQVCEVLHRMPEKKFSRFCDTGKIKLNCIQSNGWLKIT